MVAATFRLRRWLRFSILISQAKACGYQNSPPDPPLFLREGEQKKKQSHSKAVGRP